MPLILALVASSLLHVAVVVAPGWGLPEVLEAEPPPTIDAVLAKAPPPASVPAPKPAPKPPAAKPRPSSPAPVAAPAETPAAAPPVAVPPPPVEAPPPVEPPPQPAAPAAPARTALPGKGSLRYTITRGEHGFIIGQSVHSWEHDGFSYRLKNLTETIGIAAVFKPVQVLQSSVGEIDDAGLRPREFRHERAAGIDTANFDWERGLAAYAGRIERLAAGTQDLLSMYYQLVLLAPQNGALELPIATGRKLLTYRFEVLGEETLDFPSGPRRVVRIKTRSGNDFIEMWLPFGEDGRPRSLPLKIRIVDRKGEIYDQVADDPSASGTQ